MLSPDDTPIQIGLPAWTKPSFPWAGTVVSLHIGEVWGILCAA